MNISNLNIYNNESFIDYYDREKFNEIINFRYISKLY